MKELMVRLVGFLSNKLFAWKIREKSISCPFIVMSPPKCGTHLLAKTLKLISKKSPVYFGNEESDNLTLKHVLRNASHNKFTALHFISKNVLNILVGKGYKIIFFIRDPRDQLISVRNWMKEQPWQDNPCDFISDSAKQIEALITGTEKSWKCFEYCFMPFEKRIEELPKTNLYKAYFENLVGLQGGGSSKNQLAEIKGIAQLINTSLSDDRVKRIAKKLFGGTTTFRTGLIGNWKSHFTEYHKQLYKERYNVHLIRLGYEVDASW
jgi:hypothetical protein